MSTGLKSPFIKLLFILSLFLIVFLVNAQDATTHTIQPGESLQGIANFYDLSVEDLAMFNGLIDLNRIRVGQVLNIPNVPVVAPTTHTVQPGEQLDWIAQRYNTTVDALMQLNTITNPNRLTVGRVLDLPPVGGPVTFPRLHTVQPGETLRIIAPQYGTTWEVLAAANNLLNPNLIHPGNELVIPAVGGSTTPAPQTPAPAVPATVVQPPPLRYIIQRGDTLSQIADRFGVTLESLIAVNNITNTRGFVPGDTIQIPPTGGPTTPAVTSIAATQPIARPGQYVVLEGDTMFSIAARSNVSVYDIARANGILNLNSIFVGQALAIP